MNQIKVLVIGAGKWFLKTHLNSIKELGYQNVQLLCVADVEEENSKRMQQLFNSLDTSYHTDYLKLTGNIDDDKIILSDYVVSHGITCIIISSTPETHLQYVYVALDLSVDIICDKPVFAYEKQSSYSDDVDNLILTVDIMKDICNRIEQSVHWRFNRECFVFVPLRRRVQGLYTYIYDNIGKIKNHYEQTINHVNITFNDGCYRLNHEYNMLGAHSYVSGVGLMAQSGYHWIDFVAHLIKLGCDEIRKITTQVTFCRTVGDYVKEDEEKIVAKVLKSTLGNEQVDIDALDSEIDINLQYTVYSENMPACEITLSLQHSGCTNRIVKNYDKDTTHDEGRTDDCFIGIQQGSIQSFQVMFSAESSDYGPRGSAMIWHRMHPNIASENGVSSKVEYKVSLDEEVPVKSIIRELLEITSGSKPLDSYRCLSFREQMITTILYISSIIAKKTNKTVEYDMEREEFLY